MLQIKRKLKKKYSKITKIVYLFVICCLLLIFSLVGVYLYIKNQKNFISPLPVDSQALQDKQVQKKELAEKLKKQGISFVSIANFSNEAYDIHLRTGEEVIIASKKNIEVQIASLQVVLSQLTMEGKRFNRLDFRFDKPVITLNEK